MLATQIIADNSVANLGEVSHKGRRSFAIHTEEIGDQDEEEGHSKKPTKTHGIQYGAAYDFLSNISLNKKQPTSKLTSKALLRESTNGLNASLSHRHDKSNGVVSSL